MTTNGVLLNKYIKFLINYNFYLSISLDGDAYENSYRIFPDGKPSFPIIYKNLCDIKTNFPIYFKKNISFLSIQHNRNDAFGIYSFFRQFDKIPSISSVSTESVNQFYLKDFQEISTLKPISWQEIQELQKENPEIFSKNYSSSITLEKYLSPLLDEIDLFNNDLKFNKVSILACFLFKIKLFLTVSGEIFICEKSSRAYPFGKVDEKGIHFDLKKINKYYLHLFTQMNKYCLTCYDILNCNSCFFSEPSKFSSIKKCKIDYESFQNRLTDLLNRNESGQ